MARTGPAVIRHLGIRGLGVIRTADVDLGPGLVAFTGETGAGKTMLVSALGLVLGDRFDSGLLAADGTRVEAVVDIPPGAEVLQQVLDSGGSVDTDHDGAELVIARIVPPSGRGRATAGGVTVPVSVLGEVGAVVAQRHSQSDQVGLRSPRRQRDSLDRFAGPTLNDLLSRYRSAYERFTALSQALTERVSNQRDRTDRVERLRAELAAIEDVNPAPAEDDTLTTEIARLSHTQALREDVSAARAALDGDEGAASAVATAAERLRRASAHDPTLRPLADRADQLQELAADLTSDTGRYADGLNDEPGRLEELQQRKARLAPILRRFGPKADDAIAHADAVRAELASIDGGDDAVARLRDDLRHALTELAQSATALSAERESAAQALSEQVSAELAGLAMPHAIMTVAVDQREDSSGLALADGRTVAFGPTGVDVVRFLLAPHPGAAPAPIGDGASGGELSRIMLSLEVVLAASAPPSVFIFDEVDAGIGGRTAIEVGRRLARLARHSQVLVVTHLPQVASFADQHIVVRKDSDGAVTATSITEVTGTDRATELSRMMSGQSDSAAALAHAEELLDLAALEARQGVR